MSNKEESSDDESSVTRNEHNEMAIVPAALQMESITTQPVPEDHNTCPDFPPVFILNAEKQTKETISAAAISHTTAPGGHQRIEGIGVSIETTEKHQIELIASEGRLMFRERIQREIYMSLYKAACEFPATNHAVCNSTEDEEEEEEDVVPTCSERCIDCCCQSCTCSFSNPFKRTTAARSSLLAKRTVMTPTLRRGRARGWDIFNSIVFPLVRDTVRYVWVFVELLMVLISLSLSIASVLHEQNRVFNIVHLALSIVGSVLALVDTVYTLRECRSAHCKKCCHCETYDVNEKTEAGMTQSEAEADEMTLQTKAQCCKKRCFSCCKTTSDVVRLVLAELLIYPLLVCGIFSVVTGRGYDKDSSIGDRLGFALFIISSASMLLYVYIVRILLLLGMIRNVYIVRTPSKEILESALNSDEYDPSLKKSALCYHLYFGFHLVLQMIAQILMFVAIGGKINYDNGHLFETGNTNQDIIVSPFLWYMIVAGYIAPIIGFLTFFIITYYWTQEFPIGLCYDMFNLMKMSGRGKDNLLFPKEKTFISTKNMVERITSFLKPGKLKKDLKMLRNRNCCEKIVYPCTTPLLLYISLFYVAMQVSFVACAVFAIDETNDLVLVFIDGGLWFLYCMVAIPYGFFVNIYTFGMAVFSIVVLVALPCVVYGYCAPRLPHYVGPNGRPGRHNR